MKKILAIFFIVAVCAALFACGGRVDTHTSKNTMRTTMGGILPGNGTSRNTTDRTDATMPTGSATTVITGPMGGTEGTNGTTFPSTGGGTTVR